MLLFEFFPGILAIVVLVVGIFLFRKNRRAHNDPHDQETPRTPSRPPVPSGTETDPVSSSRRPSMRA